MKHFNLEVIDKYSGFLHIENIPDNIFNSLNKYEHFYNQNNTKIVPTEYQKIVQQRIK